MAANESASMILKTSRTPKLGARALVRLPTIMPIVPYVNSRTRPYLSARMPLGAMSAPARPRKSVRVSSADGAATPKSRSKAGNTLTVIQALINRKRNAKMTNATPVHGSVRRTL